MCGAKKYIVKIKIPVYQEEQKVIDCIFVVVPKEILCIYIFFFILFQF